MPTPKNLPTELWEDILSQADVTIEGKVIVIDLTENDNQARMRLTPDGGVLKAYPSLESAEQAAAENPQPIKDAVSSGSTVHEATASALFRKNIFLFSFVHDFVHTSLINFFITQIGDENAKQVLLAEVVLLQGLEEVVLLKPNDEKKRKKREQRMDRFVKQTLGVAQGLPGLMRFTITIAHGGGSTEEDYNLDSQFVADEAVPLMLGVAKALADNHPQLKVDGKVTMRKVPPGMAVKAEVETEVTQIVVRSGTGGNSVRSGRKADSLPVGAISWFMRCTDLVI
jgi:hypothetical protein